MLLILSARTVDEEIALQFGRLPPSFLPLGDRRLFSYQCELAFDEPCFMTVPDDFEICETDLREIEAAGIKLLPQSQSMSLPQAIGDALRRIRSSGQVRILYGDTLVRMSKESLRAPDTVAVHDTNANYPWAFVETTQGQLVRFSDEQPHRLDKRRVVCGYYNFEDQSLLAKACGEKTIVKALTYYNERRPLVCSESDSWLDFGHLPLYFRSKKEVLIKRVFNELIFENHLLIKRSADTMKMRAEAHWYENLPNSVQLHVPRYQGRDERDFQAGYALEYLYAPLLSDLFVFGTLPLASWLEILQACFELIRKCQTVRPPDGAPERSPMFARQFFHEMVVEKTRSRLDDFGKQSAITPNTTIELNGVQFPSLNSVAKNLVDMIRPTTTADLCFWHGDLFFGNMFYDFTSQRILCIDPRGQLASGQTCVWGDFRYDLAKLAHSIVGGYDKILLGRSRLEIDPVNSQKWSFYIESQPHAERLEEIFFAYVQETFDISESELLALTSLLFLSMLPIHRDCFERQKHLLAAGLRLAARAEKAE